MNSELYAGGGGWRTLNIWYKNFLKKSLMQTIMHTS